MIILFFYVQLVFPTKYIEIYPKNKSYITNDMKKVINFLYYFLFK